MEQPNYTKRLVPLGNTVWIAQRLKKLRKSFEEAGGQPDDHMVFALLLADVCDALGLTRMQRFGVLGWMGESYLSGWGDTLVGLTPQAEQEERATENSALEA